MRPNSTPSGGRRLGRSLEDQVRDLFRAAGCVANSREDVEGARGKENVDVLVEFSSLGFPDTWAVECKDEVRRVKRSDVQAFHKKVESIGASKGIVVTTSGYQSGCTAVAERTNILLTTLPELVESLEGKINRERLQRLLARVTALLDRLVALEKHGSRVPGKPYRRGLALMLPSGPGSERFLEYFGKMQFVKKQVTEVLLGATALRVPIDEDDPYAEEVPYQHATTEREFCDLIGGLLGRMETWASGLIPPD